MAYHFVRDPANGVRVVHPFPVVRKGGPDVHGGLVVPVGQEVVESIVR